MYVLFCQNSIVSRGFPLPPPEHSTGCFYRGSATVSPGEKFLDPPLIAIVIKLHKDDEWLKYPLNKRDQKFKQFKPRIAYKVQVPRNFNSPLCNFNDYYFTCTKVKPRLPLSYLETIYIIEKKKSYVVFFSINHSLQESDRGRSI